MKSALLVCSAMIGLTANPFAAHAQLAAAPAAAPPAAAPTYPSEGLGDIVVTARRREESLQRVPVAITAFSNQRLREQAIASPQDLNKAVPGLTVESNSGSPGLPTFAIRGRGTNYGAAAGSVETYFADVPLSAPFQAPTLAPQFFDVSAFQVLKGPQGTLFGRSTTGGAVVIVPQAPTDEFGGYIRLQGGTYGDFQAEAAVNVPLVSDKVLVRVAGFEWRRDGYSRTYPGDIETLTGQTLGAQRYNSQDQQQVRATLLVKPTDALSNSTILTYTRDDGQYSAGAGLAIAGVDPATGQITTVPVHGYGTQRSDSDVRFDNPARSAWAVINTTSYELSDAFSLKNIFGYVAARGSNSQGTNADGTTATTISLPSFPRKPRNNQLTDEVQLQGKALDDRLTFLVGGLYDQTREPKGSNTIPPISATFLESCSAVGGPANCNLVNNRFSSVDVTSYGLYGSLTFKITPKLSFTGGYRHSWDKVSEITGSTTSPVLQEPGAQAPSICCDSTRSLKSRFQGNIYNFGLDYNVTSKVLAYGGYRRGYKRGGFNDSYQGTDPAFTSFSPETVDDFYAGVKSSFDVGSIPMRFNIEGYYDKYKGQQVSYLSLNTNGSLSTITTNVDGTTYRGFELDLAAEPARWLTVTANYSYIDAYNTKWVDRTVPGLTQDLSANPVAFVSKNKFQVGARLHTNLAGDKGEIVVAPTVNYQDAFITYPNALILPYAGQLVEGAFILGAPGSFLNINGLSGGGDIVHHYATVDLRAEWNHFLGSRFDLAFNATNLTNKVFSTGNSATITFGLQGNAYGPPRLFSFEVSTKF